MAPRSTKSCGVPVDVHTAAHHYELLSVFPLTAAVQRISLEAAGQLGTTPVSFGRDLEVQANAMDGIDL